MHQHLHWASCLTNYKPRHHQHTAFDYQGLHIFKQRVALLLPRFTLAYLLAVFNNFYTDPDPVDTG